MQLIIDVGNTRVKVAVFDDDIMIAKKAVALPQFIESLGAFIAEYPIKKAIISSVGRLSQEQSRSVQLRFPTILLSHNTPLPFVNDYATPETLGVDRMALVAAFAKAYPEKNGLIIDAGTCITYDFINAAGHYKGGAISPGIQLRYQALHNLTANLPLLDVDMPETIVGNSTETAIHSGVMVGVIKEMDGIIDQYKSDFNVDTVILTGGDAEILSKRLKNSIFAHSNFLMEGLNYILRRTND
ncbi:type III pantothenate kinase [uncultured Dokdonia sp.]|uniref:type III pantothenate kinase n=1 Tax=uncultured Dokdonia sp. TaxID=575653 RepID=UPI002611C951|nr:type III pantothenate kinase [uncultured Dokdonia sp.]